MTSPVPVRTVATSSLSQKAPASSSANISRLVLLGVCVIALVYLLTIGTLPLVGRDEPRYAEVAREMWQSGDWITPRLGGYTWFEKPALLYWFLAASFSVFGLSEWSVRLGPALCGVATFVLLWWMVQRVRSDWALWSALGLATSGGLIFFSHGATFDIPLTASVTLALAGFWAAQLEKDAKLERRYQAIFWCGVGLAFLAKGLIAFILCLGTVGLYAWIRRERVKLGFAWGLPLALLVSAIWYGPVIWRNGWPFINEFFVQHHFQRFLSDKYKHHQPFWFYIPILLILSLPWSPALLMALAKLRPASLREDNNASRLRALALCWLLVPVVFFSASGSKLPGYILPALPAAFIFVGMCVSDWAMGRTGRILNASLAGLMLLVTLVATNAPQGVALAERSSMRSLLRQADARGYKAMPVVSFRTTQRAAQFYAANHLLYDSSGEPLRFDDPQKLAAFARKEDVLVMVETKSAKKLQSLRGLKASEVGKGGGEALYVLRGS